MPANIQEIIDNLEIINGSKMLLDILMEVENIIDGLGMYAYKNWELGEVVEGPDVQKYWISVTLMYPYKLMPDPSAGLRLTKHGSKVSYQKSVVDEAVKIKSPMDYADIKSKKPKMVKKRVWLVTLKIPRHLIDDFQETETDIAGEKVNLEAVTSGQDELLDNTSIAQNDSQMAPEQMAPMGGPSLPGGMPNAPLA